MPPRPSRIRRWLPHPAWLIASLVLVFALALPAAYLAMPAIHRWHRLNQLTADDPATRERALNYVIRRADDDAIVRQGAIDRLEHLEHGEHFNQLVNALDHAGVWSRRHVPDALWLRWIESLVRAPQASARRGAARQLAALSDLADRQELWQPLLTPLLADADEPTVRHDALHTAALLIPHAQRIDAASAMRPRLHDQTVAIARDAWILFGLLNWHTDTQANWRQAPARLSEAMLWTAVQLEPTSPHAAVDALREPEAPSVARASAAYALHRADPQQARDALLPVIAQRPLPHEPGPSRTLIKRAVLAMPMDHPSEASETDVEAAHLLDALRRDLWALDEAQRRVARPLLAAVCHRTPALRELSVSDELDRLRDKPVLALALLEGLPVGEHDLPVTHAEPAMVRLIATAQTDRPDLTLIEDLFAHERSPMRDLACVIAMERFRGAELDELIQASLVDPNTRARKSGAMLAGLAGTHTELLREAAAIEDNWRVQTLMHTGLWMQGQRPEMGRRMPGLLMREDLPMSSLLLALVHRGEAVGWDFLFAPHGEPAPDLHRLLTHYRWWHVLSRYLPEDAPPLWLWADTDLQRFQLEVLRNWYRLNRHHLTQASDVQ